MAISLSLTVAIFAVLSLKVGDNVTPEKTGNDSEQIVEEDRAEVKDLLPLVEKMNYRGDGGEWTGDELNEIGKSLGMFGVPEEDTEITRYQLADIQYNLLKINNKVPETDNYRVPYKDYDEIPSRYLQAVTCTTMLNFYDFGDTFNGYAYIRREELKDSMEKCNDYLAKADENTEKKEDSGGKKDENKENDSEYEDSRKETLKKEAEEILRDRVTEDRLNGKSVAIFKDPKSLDEIRANIHNVSKDDPDKLYETDAYEIIGDEVKHDYINIDQGLLDGSDLYDMELHGKPINVVGLTYAEKKFGFKINVRDDGVTIITGNIIQRINDMTRGGIAGAVGINDYKVVCSGIVPVEGGNAKILFDGTGFGEVDAIGIVINKHDYDNDIDWTKDLSEETIELLNSRYAVIVLEPDKRIIL